ncbi:MAG TPA: carbohydrate kinase family protein [Burkholderiaceae bacterium]|nr:carbohydrate kinase family protein [Burkholderiaceae bacterium]
MSELLVAGMAYLDLFVPWTLAPPPGQEVFVDDIGIMLGGATNSASVAAALGLDTALCTPHGGGIADLALTAACQRLGIALVPVAAADNPAISLVMSSRAERALVSAARYQALETVVALPQAQWILVPGLEEAARLAAPLARARAAGARIAVSGSWNPARLAALPALREPPWDLLILNEDEAGAACADVYNTPRLLAGAAKALVVTLGPAGAFGLFDGEAVNAAAPLVPVQDTTGAGDAFGAGLLAALIRGLRPADALAFGCHAAAHLVGQRGGVLQDPSRIRALRKELPWKH